MGLPAVPIIKKFFSNKIESSRPEWGDYLLEIADIFSMFDGEELDRGLLTERFSSISGRSPYALRDVANFRDEFGAYGTYLGLFHIENVDGRLRIFLSKAAKHFLCSTEPDAEAFCRTQLALFQYPNGAGAVAGARRMQINAKDDTIREIQNNIRLNPLRLICRAVVAMHSLCGIPLSDIVLPYKTIFMLFNDDSVNQCFSPTLESIKNALESYERDPIPAWVFSKNNLTNFKRNFHIFERTGMFVRVGHHGLAISSSNPEKAYSYIKTISELSTNFDGFEDAYGSVGLEEQIQSIVLSPLWGRYYDSLTMQMDVLSTLSDDFDYRDVELVTQPIGTVEIPDRVFPELRDFQTNQIRAFSPSNNQTDPFETIIRREKANREHARILTMLAAKLRANGHRPYENIFIDLCTEANNHTFIFEVKSNNTRNALSQIRKAIAQLYEYRFRSNKNGAILCIVLQQKPTQNWIEEYLLHDRGILVCWLVDDIRIECPDECYATLASIGVVE